MRRHFDRLVVRASAATVATMLGACLAGSTATAPPGGDDPKENVSLTAAGQANTFNHEIDERDPFDILKQRQEEGAPDVATRLHSCKKLSYATLGNVLTSRGVKLGATATSGMPATAGQLYMAGGSALGAPNYAARTGEAIEITTAGATKLFDVFIQAAPEVIAAMPTLPACTVNGVGARMFDDGGKCTLDGVSCLQGAPALQQHVELCDQLVASATTVDVGRKMAVATLLAAAHTCE